MNRSLCRVGIAVEPEVLAGAIAEVLARDGVDEVVAPVLWRTEHLDAAVVSTVQGTEVDADVVIELPDPEGMSSFGRLCTAGGVEPVLISGADSILALLDRCLPGDSPRAPHGS